MLPLLAESFLKQIQYSEIEWLTEQNVFHVSLGADGWPENRDPAVDFSVTLLEFGRRVHSPYNNFVIFVANAKENSEACYAFCRHILAKMKELQGRKFEIAFKEGEEDRVQEFEFRPGLILGDQKWIADFCGEVSNSATYPSSFCNVSKQQLQDTDGGIGSGEKWQEWSLDDRRRALSELKTVCDRYVKMHRYEPSREYLVKWLAELKSRQIAEPPLGEFCRLAEICILHVALLAWGDLASDFVFGFLQRICGTHRGKFRDLPENHPFCIFIHALFDAGASRFAKHLRRQWNEGAKTLDYRLRGQEVEVLCKHFLNISALFLHHCTDSESLISLCTFHKLARLLCDITRDMSRISVTEDDLKTLSKNCRCYHTLKVRVKNGSFFHQNDFTIGYVIPYRAWKIFNQFGVGLGLASMQGREHKHQVLKRFLRNANPNPEIKWFHVLFYDYISC